MDMAELEARVRSWSLTLGFPFRRFPGQCPRPDQTAGANSQAAREAFRSDGPRRSFFWLDLHP